MTCKDCIHYSVCGYVEFQDLECNHFKNKADFVKVVRCGKCKHWETGKDCEPYCNHFCNMMTYTKADDYCSFGERRDT